MTGTISTLQKNVPKCWKIVDLIEVAGINTESRDPTQTPDKRFLYTDIDAVENGTGVITSVKELSGKDAPSRARRVVHTDDIIMSEVRPYLKAFALIPKKLNNQICSTGFAVLRSNDEINPHYLLYTLFSTPVIEQCNRMMVGAQYPALNDAQVKKIRIPLPPLPEQRRITAILSTVDDAIQRSRQAALEVERLKAGVMQELMTQGIGHTEFRDDPDVGWIPKAWTVSTIGNVSERFLNGGTPSTKNPAFWEGTIQWTTSSILTSFYLDRGECAISKEGLEKSASNLIPKGNVLVATRVGIGKVAINRIDIAINQDLTGIILDKSKIMPEFFVWLLLSDKYNRKLKGMSRGTTIKGLIRDELERIPLPLPHPAEQQKIATILSTIDRKLSLQRQRTTHYEKIRQGLMSDLLTGRKRVKVT